MKQLSLLDTFSLILPLSWTTFLLPVLLVPLLIALNVLYQLLPSRSSRPPVVFHWVPFIGSAIAYGTDPLGFFSKCREKYGNVFTFILFGRHVTVALGAKGNNFILGGKSIVFNAEDAYTHFTTPVFGEDVVYDVPNATFMEQKKFAKTAFTLSKLRSYVPLIEDEVDEFLNTDLAFAAFQSRNTDVWGTFDAVQSMQEVILLTAARSLQGKEVRSKLDASFAQNLSDLDGGFTPLNFIFPNLPLPSYRRRDQAQQRMAKFYMDIINERRESGVEDDETDAMASLMRQVYRNGKAITDKEVAHLLIALLMGGQHTSAATAAWALLRVASRPDIEEALYQEQLKHFSNGDGSFRTMTYDELRDLPVLDAVIRETLRLHPPIHSLFRKVRDDVPVPATLASPASLKGGEPIYVIPKGTYVLSCGAASQTDPAIWKNASEWDPHRWSDPQGVAAMALRTYNDETGEKIDYGFGAVSKGTESPYQPFGAGRHRCIGEQFAYLQIGTILATMIRRMELRLHTTFPENDYTTMITLPKSPRAIHYRRRKSFQASQAESHW